MKTCYEFADAFEELMDDALNTLSPEEFEQLKDSIDMILMSYED